MKTPELVELSAWAMLLAILPAMLLEVMRELTCLHPGRPTQRLLSRAWSLDLYLRGLFCPNPWSACLTRLGRLWSSWCCKIAVPTVMISPQQSCMHEGAVISIHCSTAVESCGGGS